MRHLLYLTLCLVIFWLLNSGQYSVLIIGLGAISVLAVVLLTHRMDIIDDESQPLHLTIHFVSYMAWLAKETVMANISVVKHIWLGKESINPVMAEIEFDPMSDFKKVLYANSITITPGTVTVDLTEDHVLVHSLLSENIETLKGGDMCRRISGVSE